MTYTYPVCFIKRKNDYLIYLPDFKRDPIRVKRIEEAVVMSRKFLKDNLILLKNSGTRFPKATNYDKIDVSAVAKKFQVSDDDVLVNIIDESLPRYSIAKKKANNSNSDQI